MIFKNYTKHYFNYERTLAVQYIPFGSEFPQSILSSRVRPLMLVTVVKPAKIERAAIFMFDDFFFFFV